MPNQNKMILMQKAPTSYPERMTGTPEKRHRLLLWSRKRSPRFSLANIPLKNLPPFPSHWSSLGLMMTNHYRSAVEHSSTPHPPVATDMRKPLKFRNDFLFQILSTIFTNLTLFLQAPVGRRRRRRHFTRLVILIGEYWTAII